MKPLAVYTAFYYINLEQSFSFQTVKIILEDSPK